jgi:hypothetical protein
MMRPLVLALQPIAALVLFVSACTTPGPKYPDLSSFCMGVANAECNSRVVMQCALMSGATCVANRNTLCLASQPSGTHYNAGAGEDCVAEYASVYADAVVTLAEMAAITNGCIQVFEGNGMTNASCVADSDCQVGSGLRCVTSSAGTSTCQVPVAVSGGGKCDAPNEQCLAGFHCGTSAHCDQDGVVNDPCSALAPCGSTLLCAIPTGATTGTCVNKSADGSACTSASDCTNGICDIAQTMATGLCVSQLTLAPNEPFCVDAR